MDLLIFLFGVQNNVNFLQMCLRAIIVFFLALLLIRIAGRRSFGLKAPLDNIISILLGAILSRAVVGSAPFFSTAFSCLVISILHRWFSRFAISYDKFEILTKGSKILLYENSQFMTKNMKRALVSHEDIMESIRSYQFSENMNNIDKIYMERNGQISILKK
jgi:uncharacterized membrane protein YcaP (DUF421 family)